ncbi:MAG: polysaccharide deacetylase family protein, partial [Anaerolineales bacterium]|nr:polysaccharide deacetylase family protein [Anaerolineales bacterium]
VSITFDDGYANNFSLGYPLLHKYQLPATIFLSSFYVETGELFPFLKLHLIQLYAKKANVNLQPPLPSYKSQPLDHVMDWAQPHWENVVPQLHPTQLHTLRPLRVEEVERLDSSLISLGAHNHTHCILSNETSERRRWEVLTSLRKVGQWAGKPITLYSYPNGQQGDFNEEDKRTLQAAGVTFAVSGIPGANPRNIDPLELRRYPIGLYHDPLAFHGEITGLRTLYRNARRRLA